MANAIESTSAPGSPTHPEDQSAIRGTAADSSINQTAAQQQQQPAQQPEDDYEEDDQGVISATDFDITGFTTSVHLHCFITMGYDGSSIRQ